MAAPWELAHLWPMILAVLWLAIAGVLFLEKKYAPAALAGASGAVFTAFVVAGAFDSVEN